MLQKSSFTHIYGQHNVIFFSKFRPFFAVQFFVVLFVQRELHFSCYPICCFGYPRLSPSGVCRGDPQNFGASCIKVSRGLATRSPQINQFFNWTQLYRHTQHAHTRHTRHTQHAHTRQTQTSTRKSNNLFFFPFFAMLCTILRITQFFTILYMVFFFFYFFPIFLGFL